MLDPSGKAEYQCSGSYADERNLSTHPQQQGNVVQYQAAG